MPFIIISVLLQASLVLHIVKTGRDTKWIWLVMMLPLAGSIAYIVVEVLPDILGSRAGRQAQNNIQNIVNPNRHINAAAKNCETADTVENSIKLAEECLHKKMFAEAKQLFDESRTGMHQYAPDIMYGLARSEYGLDNYARVKEILDDLIAKNPEYTNADAHLLFAQTAEKLGNTSLALEEFEALDGYYSGPEASYHYAQLLKKEGQEEKATAIFKKIIDVSKRSGRHYLSIHKVWINKAKDAYRAS